MSNTRRHRDKRRQRAKARAAAAPSSDAQKLPVTKIQQPADIVAIIPYLLGFDPVESLVVVGLEGTRKRFGPCFRLDLAVAEDVDAQVAYIATLVAHLGFGEVILVAFSDLPEHADPVVRGVCERMRRDGVGVHEALRADGSRWWSYTCDNPRCCPPSGSTYDADASRVSAEAVVAGMQRRPSRDALRDQFAPDPSRRDAIARARTTSTVPLLDAADIIDAIDGALCDPAALEVSQQLQLMQSVQAVGPRDMAWMLMSRDTAGRHLALWAPLMRAAPDDLLAPVGSLAAFAAWLQGRGVLASHAAERVLEVQPDYSMATLIMQMLESAVDPMQWDVYADNLAEEDPMAG